MTKKGIRISSSLVLPIDAITQTLACIGKRGAGKTYLASMIAEQMLDAGAQVIVLDPIGNWWGLRVGSDGKSKGKDIFVIGGVHGDVGITPESGNRIAALLVEKRVSVVLDISQFRKIDRKRFAADFAEEFFQLKKAQKSPTHVMVEEAQVFAPQFPRPSKGGGFDETRMLGAFEDIIRLGRNYGIGATLITQRPQSVNKEVLSQTECLCVLQVNGVHEREALESWVQEVGADRNLVDELPGLMQGEGYVWSPSWLRIFKRMEFAKKTTFDSSATPKIGAKVKAALIAKIDVASLKADLQEVIAKAEKDDPKALHKRIAELEKELKSKPAAPAAPPAPIERVDREQLLNAQREEIERIVRDVIRPEIQKVVGGILDSSARELEKLTNVMRGSHTFVMDDTDLWATKFLSKTAKVAIRNSIVKSESIVAVRSSALTPNASPAPRESTPPAEGLSGPEQRILDAIAWHEAIGIDKPDQVAVAFLAGYSPKGGAFRNPRGHLKILNLVDYEQGGRISLTVAGRELAQHHEVSTTDEALHQRILERLPGPEQRLLRVLLDAYPGALDNLTLATAAGYAVLGGAFRNPRGRLKSFGLIDYVDGGRLRARDLFFPRRTLGK